MTTDTTIPAAHLWDVDHPDYCEDGNYYKFGLIDRFKSWGHFLDYYKSFAKSTLLFRWDWKAPLDDDDDGDQLIRWEGDENYRDCELCLYWMGQSKAASFSIIVDVCRADEANVRAWLQDRFAYIVALWEPFSKH